MNTVTIEVAGRSAGDARFLAAVRTGRKAGAFITFPTVEALWSTLTAKRWEIVRALAGVGPVSLRGVARRVGRDVQGGHGDVRALVGAGVLGKPTRWGIVFPHNAVRADFTLPAPAAGAAIWG